MEIAKTYSAPWQGSIQSRFRSKFTCRGGCQFFIVGLPETAVKESRERVRSAILTNRFEFPTKRITVNLAPADLPKEGGRYDLAIAIGILAASGQVARDSLHHHEFIGELSLTGDLRPVGGILPCAHAINRIGRALVLPAQTRRRRG